MDKQFDYGKRVWGLEDARLSPTNWAALKLKYALKALRGVEGKVLDVGCGGGVFTRGIKHYRKDLDLWGIDISRKSIDFAKSVSKNVNFVLGSAYKLPFKDDTFDAAVSFDVLEHLDKPTLAIREAKRVLKPGGIFHLVTPVEASLFTFHGVLFKVFGYNLKEKQIGHINHFTYQGLVDQLKRNGFTPIENRYTAHFFIQFIDTLYNLVIAIFKLGKKDPSFSLEKHIKRGKRNWLRKAFASLYNLIVFISYMESKAFFWLPGYCVNVTLIKSN